jgi:hypothetical protein
MNLPGFAAEASLAASGEHYHRVAQTEVPSSAQVVVAYYCIPEIATCDCFGWWDCLRCTYEMWPRPCRNPFG